MHVFWGMKKLVQLKFVQLFLLNRVKGKIIKKPCCSRFYYINSFSSNIFGSNSKTCTCKVRAAWASVSQGLSVFVKKDYLTRLYNNSHTYLQGQSNFHQPEIIGRNLILKCHDMMTDIEHMQYALKLFHQYFKT